MYYALFFLGTSKYTLYMLTLSGKSSMLKYLSYARYVSTYSLVIDFYRILCAQTENHRMVPPEMAHVTPRKCHHPECFLPAHL